MKLDGAGQREQLAGRAGEVYLEIVEAGGISAEDPRLRANTEDRAAVEILIELGLLSPVDDGFEAVDPSYVQGAVMAPIASNAGELLAESAAWADTFGALRDDFRKASQTSGFQKVHGRANINRLIDATIAEARTELLTAAPDGPRPPEALEKALKDLRRIDPQVKVRTLYQHTARRSRAVQEYVAAVMEFGVQVRTLDEFFNRLVVVDRMTAFIPSATDSKVAVVIRDDNLIGYLVDIFERTWERATPYDRGAGSKVDISEQVRTMTARMLVEGHSDPASAKRVGVSTRTYAGYVAALKQEYQVETRFQLGYAMGRRAAVDGPIEGLEPEE